MSASHRGILYGLLAAAIWGGMYVVSDVVLRVIPPFTLLSIRLILGALVLGILYFLRQNTEVRLTVVTRGDASTLLAPPVRLTGRNLGTLIGVGMVGFGISVGAQFVGTDLSTAVNGALITSASPAFILVFAALILREPLTLRRIGAVALATVGVVVIIDPTQVDLSSELFAGNAALALAALTWGLYSVLVRRVSAVIDTTIVTVIAFLGGLLLTIPASVVELQTRSVSAIDVPVAFGILYLGVVSTAGAMWLWNRAFALVDAGTASLTFFAQPLVGALLGAALLGQELTPSRLIGGLLIAIGVLLALRRA